jgi:hypothetical protein
MTRAQLADVSRGGHPGRVAAFVRTGARLRLRLRRLTVLGRVWRSLVDGDGFQTGRRQFERVTLSTHQSTWRRERKTQRFKSPGSA